MTTHDALSAGKRAERSPLSSVTNPLPQIYGMKPERALLGGKQIDLQQQADGEGRGAVQQRPPNR